MNSTTRKSGAVQTRLDAVEELHMLATTITNDDDQQDEEAPSGGEHTTAVDCVNQVSLGDFMVPKKSRRKDRGCQCKSSKKTTKKKQVSTTDDDWLSPPTSSASLDKSAALVQDRLAAAVRTFEERIQQEHHTSTPQPPAAANGSELMVDVVVERAPPEGVDVWPVHNLPYDCWSVIFSYLNDPLDALNTANSDSLLQLTIEQSGIFDKIWRAFETFLRDADAVRANNHFTAMQFGRRPQWHRDHPSMTLGLWHTELVGRSELLSRMRFPWSKRLSLHYREVKSAVLSHLNKARGAHWVNNYTQVDDRPGHSVLVQQKQHQQNSHMTFVDVFQDTNWFDVFFDDEEVQNIARSAMRSTTKLPTPTEVSTQAERKARHLWALGRAHGDNELSESDLEEELVATAQPAVHYRHQQTIAKRQEVEVRAWLELYHTTRHPLAKQFARIQANRFAGMYNVASKLAEEFDFTKLSTSLAKRIRAPATPEKVHIFLSNLRMRSLDHFMENERDICLTRVDAGCHDHQDLDFKRHRDYAKVNRVVPNKHKELQAKLSASWGAAPSSLPPATTPEEHDDKDDAAARRAGQRRDLANKAHSSRPKAAAADATYAGMDLLNSKAQPRAYLPRSSH